MRRNAWALVTGWWPAEVVHQAVAQGHRYRLLLFVHAPEGDADLLAAAPTTPARAARLDLRALPSGMELLDDARQRVAAPVNAIRARPIMGMSPRRRRLRGRPSGRGGQRLVRHRACGLSGERGQAFGSL